MIEIILEYPRFDAKLWAEEDQHTSCSGLIEFVTGAGILACMEMLSVFLGQGLA